METFRARAIGCFYVVSAFACLAGEAYGQGPLSFEVASVKRNVSGGARLRFETPPGRLTATNAPLRFLIRQAYRVPEARILGGSAWIDTERFDILANAPAGAAATSDGVRAMLRTLLAERFGLVLHAENRDMPIYSLRIARADRKLGPNLHESTTKCTGQAPRTAGGRVECGVLVSQAPASASLRGGAATIAEFARFLGDFLDRPLVDETGLTGTFDLDLQFSAVRSSLPREAVPGGLGVGNVDEVPTVFTAIQEQLGLKLDSKRQITEVFVVERVSQPTEN